MIRTWYIIYNNSTGKNLALIDAINEAEAQKILSQSAIATSVERIEDMHKECSINEKQDMINSFNQSKQQLK